MEALNLSAVELALEQCLTPIYKELTLQQAQALTGISPAMLRRRSEIDPDWRDVMYKAGNHFRTTLYLIGQAQARSAERARGKR